MAEQVGGLPVVALIGARPVEESAEPEPEIDGELVQKPPWRVNTTVWWEKFAGEDAMYLLLRNGEPVQFCGAGRPPKWGTARNNPSSAQGGAEAFRVLCMAADGRCVRSAPCGPHNTEIPRHSLCLSRSHLSPARLSLPRSRT